MKLFHKRPLSLILCVILGGFSLFAIFSPLNKAIAISLSLLFAVLVFAFPSFFGGKIAKIAAIALILSFVISFAYFDVFFYPNEFNGESCEIEAKVLDAEMSDTHQTLSLKIKSINGKRVHYKFKLYLYGDNEYISPGSLIKFNAVIQGFSQNGSFDYKNYYTARGYSAAVDSYYVELDSKEDAPLEYRFRVMREALCERAKKLSGEEAGELLGALLLGERTMISGQLELDFRRIGITHVLSLGGMHLAILMGGFDKLLSVFRVGKRSRIVVGCLFCILFMGLTGFPITVVRAGVMLIISSVLYLLSGCKDSVTSLFLGSAIIMAVEPFAAYDIGFWLSILATVGILLAGELLNRLYSTDTGAKKAFKAIGTSALFSLFAIASTAAVTALSFDSSSTISIIATTVFAVPIDTYVYLGALMLVVGDFIPIGRLLVLLCGFITDFSGWLSELNYVFASTSFVVIQILLILLSALFAIFAISKIKRKKIFIALLTAVYISSAVLSIGFTEQEKLDDRLVIYNTGDSDTVISCSNGNTLMFDASYHRASDAYNKIKILSDEQIVDLDCYMIASYSDYIPLELDTLLTSIRIKKIMLPLPRDEYEENIAIEILSLNERYRMNVEFYDESDVIQNGEFSIMLSKRSEDKNAFAVVFVCADSIYSYLSSGVVEYCPDSYELFYLSDTLVFGEWGAKYTTPITVDEFGLRLCRVIINGEGVVFDGTDSNAPPKLYINSSGIKIYD